MRTVCRVYHVCNWSIESQLSTPVWYSCCFRRKSFTLAIIGLRVHNNEVIRAATHHLNQVLTSRLLCNHIFCIQTMHCTCAFEMQVAPTAIEVNAVWCHSELVQYTMQVCPELLCLFTGPTLDRGYKSDWIVPDHLTTISAPNRHNRRALKLPML